jgi:hypothetical protein
VTDGEPTDSNGYISIEDFEQSITSRSPIDRIFINFIACTDDESSISYLNKWDRNIR